jgi:hypothetical protein
MNRKNRSYLAAVMALTFIPLSGSISSGQTSSAPFTFRAGESVYIVAFRRERQPVVAESLKGSTSAPDYIDLELDAEKKVRTRIEEWRFFRVADKPSEADFVFLVSLDDNSIEGLAIPFEAYRRHFKEKFDLDALRDAAYGRYLAGPLKVATLSRLSDRVVKAFREKVTNAAGSSK